MERKINRTQKNLQSKLFKKNNEKNRKTGQTLVIKPKLP